MGLFIELIKTIAEAIEESRGQQGAPRPPARPVAAEAEDTVEHAERRLADLRHAAQRPTKTELERARAEAALRAKVEATAARAKAEARGRAALAAEHAAGRLPADPERIPRLLRQPSTLRDLVVLKEILDRPLALRRDRR